MEAVCYYAYWASTELAEERGRYSSYKGFVVGSRHHAAGIAQAARRTSAVATLRSIPRSRWTGDALRTASKIHGMRNSNSVAIAPTATISNIIGVGLHRAELREPVRQIEPPGEFTVINEHLVDDLKAARPVGRSDDRRPQVFRRRAGQDRPHPGRPRRPTTPPRSRWTRCGWSGGARRQKWIDQAQSLNIYMAGASGKSSTSSTNGMEARSQDHLLPADTGATSAEKSTGRGGELNAIPSSGGIAH